MLLLFDIDGTLLLRASAEHATALREALASVYETPAPPQRISAAGQASSGPLRWLGPAPPAAGPGVGS